MIFGGWKGAIIAGSITQSVATTSDIVQRTTRTGLYEYTDGENLDVAMYNLYTAIRAKKELQSVNSNAEQMQNSDNNTEENSERRKMGIYEA